MAIEGVTQARYFDGQLTSGTPTRQYTFAYDKSSNRTNETLFLGGIQQYANNFAYNGANQISNGGFTYDHNGNLTNDGAAAYTWDRANRLLSKDSVTFAYNGLGHRVSQTVSNVVMHYLQDTQPGLFKTLKTTYVGAIPAQGPERFVHDMTGIHTQEDSAGNWDWILKDGLNSVRSVYDSAGNFLEARQYAPYGQTFSNVGIQQSNYGYTGELEDWSEFIYLCARYYDPALGNFISQDPLETANRYAYVMGNPVNRIDPSGMVYETPNRFDSCGANSLQAGGCTFTVDGAGNIVFLNPSASRDSGCMTYLNRLMEENIFWCMAYDHDRLCAGGNNSWFCNAYMNGMLARNPATYFRRATGQVPANINQNNDYDFDASGSCRRDSLIQGSFFEGWLDSTCQTNRTAVILPFGNNLEKIDSVGVLVSGSSAIPVGGYLNPAFGGSLLLVFDASPSVNPISLNLNLSSCLVVAGFEGGATIGEPTEGTIGAIMWSTGRASDAIGASANISTDALYVVNAGISRTPSCDYTMFIGPSLPLGSSANFTFALAADISGLLPCETALNYLGMNIDIVERYILNGLRTWQYLSNERF